MTGVESDAVVWCHARVAGKKAKSKSPGDPRGAELLEAILKNPSDWDLRLVYADWLMERGDPRGELIKLQIDGDSGAERRFMKKHGQKRFLEPFASFIHSARFEGGFVEGVTGDAAKLAEGLDTIVRNTPLQRVKVTGATRKSLAALAETPALERVSILDVAEQRITADQAQFFRSKHLSNVRELVAWGNPLGDEGVAVLAESASLRGLVRLELMSANIHEAGARSLAGATFKDRLEHLDLWNNPLGPEGGRAIATLPALKDLNVASCQLDDDTVAAFVEAMAQRGFVYLTASDNRVGAKTKAVIEKLDVITIKRGPAGPVVSHPDREGGRVLL